MSLWEQWFEGLKQDDVEGRRKREQSVRSSADTLNILQRVLDKEIYRLSEVPPKLEDYENPSWALLQADRAGQLRSIRNIRKLTELSAIS